MKRHNPQSSIAVKRLKHFTDFSQRQRESDSHVDECQLLALCSCEASRKWGTLGYVRPSTFPYPNNNYPQFTLCPRGTRSKQSKNITTSVRKCDFTSGGCHMVWRINHFLYVWELLCRQVQDKKSTSSTVVYKAPFYGFYLWRIMTLNNISESITRIH